MLAASLALPAAGSARPAHLAELTLLTCSASMTLHTVVHQASEQPVKLAAEILRSLGLFDVEAAHQWVVFAYRHDTSGVIDHEKKITDLAAVLEVIA